ncbi:hypothetical protein LTX13_002361 [Clostridium perfringens]|nr:hypothetical protein [Clostridium perfringens]
MDFKIDAIKKYILGELSKSSIFIVFQTLFLIELYWLGMNALIGYLDLGVISNYNNMLLKFFNQNFYLIIIIGGSLCFCGIAFTVIKLGKVLKYYKIFNLYCDAGIIIGIWSIAIGLTYYIYLKCHFAILILPIVIWGIEKILFNLMKEKTPA